MSTGTPSNAITTAARGGIGVLSLLFGAVGLFGAITAVLIAREALIANLDAVTQATAQAVAAQGQLDTMQAAQRPWVAILRADPKVPLTFNEFGGHLRVELGTKNVGHYPAFHILPFAEMFTRSGDAHELADVWNKCAKARYRRMDRPPTGVTAFPDQDLPEEINFFFPWKDINRLKAAGSNDLGTAVLIAGCLDYVFPPSPRHHQTAFMYEVWRSGPTESGLIAIDPLVPSTPPSVIRLMLNPSLAGDAD